MHTPLPLTNSWKKSPAAHAKSHVPRLALKLPPAAHAVQFVGSGPLHSAQLPSQTSQAAAASSYLPGGHAATHAPSSLSGVPAAGHVTHEVADAAEHVSQDA